MHNLKKRILEIFENRGHLKSPEAEADLILLGAFRKKFPNLSKPSELFSPLTEKRYPVTPDVEEVALHMVEERLKGVPLQHITQNQFFFEHDYLVNSQVLIPRPETEVLISQALNYIQNRWQHNPFRFSELGLGSGILSIEILNHFKRSIGLASEVSPQAIAMARQNLDHILGIGNWEDRFSILEPGETHVGFEVFSEYKPVDLIISNPPYLSVNDEIESEVLRHEPHLALFPMIGGQNDGGGENPNFFYENFLYHHSKILKKDGVVFFEIPHERADSIRHEFVNAGFGSVSIIHDLTDRARVLIAQR